MVLMIIMIYRTTFPIRVGFVQIDQYTHLLISVTALAILITIVAIYICMQRHEILIANIKVNSDMLRSLAPIYITTYAITPTLG